MNEQFIYIMQVRNKHTGNFYIKLGFTSNILNRLQQLENTNIHYEYTNVMLFKHNTRLLGYIHDEQNIHRNNTKLRATIKRDSMPNGYTECYEYFYKPDLIHQLKILGYDCVYDESANPTEQQTMIQWEGCCVK